jgi:chemotaxis protein methyltransferase CheR
MAAVTAVEVELEIQLLLQAIYHAYQYDFRDYAMASLKRRLPVAAQRLGCRTISGLQEAVLHDRRTFTALLQYLTVPVTDMFRDPLYFRALRESVVPVLRTYPSLRIWIAGCSSGEEVYSFAILLREEQLLERTMIYATDINPESLGKAEAGVYDVDRFRQFSDNYRQAGGTGSLSDYYHAAHGAAVIDKSLKKRIVFSDHSLTTDSVFAEMQMVSCRNVLIYFNRALQNRVISLFTESLCRKGFLGIGSRETLRFTTDAPRYVEVRRDARIYQKLA